MCDALRQEHQIAVKQFFPSLNFRIDPAWTPADKVKTKQVLLWKGDAPWMSELAPAIVDATQAEVLQDLTQSVHWDRRR
jgi:hypothetical protein